MVDFSWNVFSRSIAFKPTQTVYTNFFYLSLVLSLLTTGSFLIFDFFLIFYRYDFASTEKNLLTDVIPQWLDGKKKEIYLKVVNSGKLKVKKLKYDWTTDAVPSGKIFQGRPRGR